MSTIDEMHLSLLIMNIQQLLKKQNVMHHSFWKKQSAWIVYRISLTTWTSFTFSGIRRISRAFYRLLGCISWRARAWLWHFQSLIAQIKLWVFSTFTNESGLKTNFYPHRQHFIWVHPIIHFDLILSNTLPKWLLTGMTSQVQSNRIVWKINSKTSGTLVQPRKNVGHLTIVVFLKSMKNQSQCICCL